jgi:hypothetical protein
MDASVSLAPRPAHLRTLRLSLPDGASTNAHVATHPLASTRVRVYRLPALTPLGRWCAETNTAEALVGGFYLREARATPADPLTGVPLGELWTDGVAQPSVPFLAPWHERRACLHVADGQVRIARRDELPAAPAGDLLQAGPMLVRDGAPVTAGAAQFDSDITVGRHPRAALGIDGDRLIALVCDGRADHDAGLTLDELATAMLELGATHALNLDGGGSASLVCGGVLRNVPRESHGLPVPGGRAIATAVVFTTP